MSGYKSLEPELLLNSVLQVAQGKEPVARQQYRQHLIASLDEFHCNLLPSSLVQRKLHKPESAAVEVPYLCQSIHCKALIAKTLFTVK